MFFVLFDKNIVRLGTRKRNLILRSWAIELSWFFLSFLFFLPLEQQQKKQRFFFFGKKKVPVNERLGSFPKLHWSLFYVLFEVSLNICSRQAFFLSSCWRKPRSFEIVQKRVPNFLNRDTPNLGLLLRSETNFQKVLFVLVFEFSNFQKVLLAQINFQKFKINFLPLIFSSKMAWFFPENTSKI